VPSRATAQGPRGQSTAPARPQLPARPPASCRRRARGARLPGRLAARRGGAWSSPAAAAAEAATSRAARRPQLPAASLPAWHGLCPGSLSG